MNGRLLAVQVYGGPGIRNAVCVGDNFIKPLRAPTVFDDNCHQSHCCAESDVGSTLTPTPIVLDTESFFRKIPFVAAGLALFRASTSAARFSRSCSGVNEARPIVHCTTPALSARNCTWPALAFFTAPATSGVTVPTFGFGIRPRGPRIWPSWPTTRIASGA